MEIRYCVKCQGRIPEPEVSMGLAFVTDEGDLICASCWQKAQDSARRRAQAAAKETPAPTRKAKKRTVCTRCGRTTGAGRKLCAICEAALATKGRLVKWLAGGGVALVLALSGGGVLVALRRRGAPGGAKTVTVAKPEGKDDEAGAQEAEKDSPADEPARAEKLRKAKEAFRRIASLVIAGDLRGAEAELGVSRQVLSGTKYESEAERLLRGAKAEVHCRAIERLVKEEQWAEALDACKKAEAESEGTDYEAKIGELGELARGKLRAKDLARLARELEEKRRKENCERLLDLGKEQLARGDFGAAAASLEEAQRNVDTPEIRELLVECSFRRELAGARRLAEAGELDKAVTGYVRALETRDDGEAREELVLLTKRQAFLEALRRAEEAADASEWKRARELFLAVRKMAPGKKDSARIERRLAAMRRELEFAAALRDADLAAGARRWAEAIRSVRRALAIRDDERADRLLESALKALEPGGFTNSVGMELVVVPAGTLEMGSASGRDDERPVHEVRLEAFYIGRTEVTNAQFEAFDSSHKSRRGRCCPRDDHPAVNLSYEDATAFCEWLSKEEKRRYRLPTEAEWERAARGSGERTYPWGDGPPASDGAYRCNFGMRARKGWGRDGFVRAAPVGRYVQWASPFGCLDMAGNALEWCADWYSPDYYAQSPGKDPVGPGEGPERALRGGSWTSSSRDVRSTARFHLSPAQALKTVGFRVVCELGKPEP